jgi:hypothetical protein
MTTRQMPTIRVRSFHFRHRLRCSESSPSSHRRSAKLSPGTASRTFRNCKGLAVISSAGQHDGCPNERLPGKSNVHETIIPRIRRCFDPCSAVPVFLALTTYPIIDKRRRYRKVGNLDVRKTLCADSTSTLIGNSGC